MCATAECVATGLSDEDAALLRGVAREWHIEIGVEGEARTPESRWYSLQPLHADGKGMCWCSAGETPEGAVWLAGLRRTLRWMAERADEVMFEPDCFGYLHEGEATVAPEDVPMPRMGDGRRFTVRIELEAAGDEQPEVPRRG
ncbi:MAG TPA: hypothetical protein VFH61_12305 [Thermoleophilia bacterium]|nr:hypothetical protein [Thermoleophilia bacterium]